MKNRIRINNEEYIGISVDYGKWDIYIYINQVNPVMNPILMATQCHKPLIWGCITQKNADFRDGQWHFLFTTLDDSYNPIVIVILSHDHEKRTSRSSMFQEI